MWRLQHTLSTLSSINSPPTVFSVKHIRSYLWYPHRVKSKAESLSTSCSATTRLPWQPGDLIWIVLFCLWSFLSRFRFSVPPTWRAVAWWLHLFGGLGLFGFGHWKLRWVQTSDLWPPPPVLILPLRYSVPLPDFAHPLLFLCLARFCTSWLLIWTCFPTKPLEDSFTGSSEREIQRRRWWLRSIWTASSSSRLLTFKLGSRSPLKGKQSCLMRLPGWILRSQSAANELQHHMPNMAAWSLPLFLSGCYAAGAALRQFQVQVLHVFVLALTWCVTSIKVGLHRPQCWIYILTSCQLALSRLVPRFIHVLRPCPGQGQLNSAFFSLISDPQRGVFMVLCLMLKASCWVCTESQRDLVCF